MFCQICGNFSDTILCPGCEANLAAASFSHCYGTRCPSCNSPVLDLQYPCLLCSHAVRAYGRYEPPLSTLIKRYKFGSERNLSKVFAPLYHTMLQDFGNVALIPVPSSRKGYRDRGFDQMDCICNFLKKSFGYPVLHILVGQGRGEQKFLTSEQRKLRIGYAVVKGKHALVKTFIERNYSFILVDDISTTGRTLEQCGKLLYQSYGIQSSSIVLALA
ncbi:putative amidophosphoribosyltransferase [Sphaerochaeta pleomorpha str. Grapes]|uniref:Putative amidophosphoribosyltransferase n=1 Tax=Sphaerochaeta pleomorpha (strain ATCC BAA-1885 / DSM 22778 / Grapes) TaxID=158190 RepID=G8QW21_SPHPG|nr:ComF family protein [Sphaerochaeta pleomorpha]AEV28264.1 putative amidophosphoribosyltransferase [Sphaerochaeta pleomorpha str. Grapes]